MNQSTENVAGNVKNVEVQTTSTSSDTEIEQPLEMDHLNKPERLSLEGNVSENWKKFKKQLENFMKAAGSTKKLSDQKCAIMLNLIGEEAFDMLDTFEIAEEKKDSFDDVMKAYEDYCTPKGRVMYERYLFYNRNQHEGEAFDHWYTEVRKLVKLCKFIGGTDAERELTRDRLILGTSHRDLQERFIKVESPPWKQSFRNRVCTSVQAARLKKYKADYLSTRLDRRARRIISREQKIVYFADISTKKAPARPTERNV